MTSKSSIEKKEFIISFIYIAINIMIAYVALRYALPVLLPFIFAFLLSYFAEPVIGVMVKRLHVKRSVASVSVILLLVLTAVSIALLLSFFIADKIGDLYSRLPQYLDKLTVYFRQLEEKSSLQLLPMSEKIVLSVFKYLKGLDIATLLSGSIGNIAVKSFSGLMSSIPYILISFIITFVAAIFISSSFKDIKLFILMQFNAKNRELIFEIRHSTAKVFKKYVKSYILLMLITFSELYVLFMLFKIRPSLILAIVIACIDILPVFGVGTVMIPWAIICLLCKSVTKGIVLLSIYAVVTVIRQIIEPKILGSGTGLHPFAMLLSIYIGMRVLGVLGVLIMPITLVIIKDLQSKKMIKIWNEKPVDN